MYPARSACPDRALCLIHIYAISCLSEREQYVLMARVLRENSFKDIAEALHMSYKGAAAIYYRAVNKVKRNMGATT